jgi:tRNA U34 5-methylaminomethyl-2-thiouridine-forming methyltransferase MnmC
VGRELIVTKDGSHSLLHTELNETYHSVHGAIQESRHVFIDNGLSYVISCNGLADVNVLEIGFGTGLNALLSAQAAAQFQIKLNYATIEAFPLAREVWSKLNYTETLGDPALFESLHEVSWELEHAILPNFLLKKYYATLQEIKFLPGTFDLVYYDAFAPAKQPEMWTRDLLEKVVAAMRQKGVLVTYCARGQFKRDLASLGMKVETLPGPPGKKEMVRATKS